MSVCLSRDAAHPRPCLSGAPPVLPRVSAVKCLAVCPRPGVAAAQECSSQALFARGTHPASPSMIARTTHPASPWMIARGTDPT